MENLRDAADFERRQPLTRSDFIKKEVFPRRYNALSETHLAAQGKLRTLEPAALSPVGSRPSFVDSIAQRALDNKPRTLALARRADLLAGNPGALTRVKREEETLARNYFKSPGSKSAIR